MTYTFLFFSILLPYMNFDLCILFCMESIIMFNIISV